MRENQKFYRHHHEKDVRTHENPGEEENVATGRFSQIRRHGFLEVAHDTVYGVIPEIGQVGPLKLKVS